MSVTHFSSYYRRSAFLLAPWSLVPAWWGLHCPKLKQHSKNNGFLRLISTPTASSRPAATSTTTRATMACHDFTVACLPATGERGQMLRPEVRRRRIWLHDCSLCRVLCFTFIVGRGNPCAKKAATQTMSGCKKNSVYRLDVCMFAIIE